MNLDWLLPDTSTAEAILSAALFTASTQTWGNEVYFNAPVLAISLPNNHAVVYACGTILWLASSCMTIC